MGHILDYGNQLAGSSSLGNFHPDISHLLPPGLMLTPHFYKGPHSSLVTGSARLDTLPDPCFLLCQFFIKTGMLTVFYGQHFLLASQIGIVISGPAGDIAALQVQYSGCQLLEEITVMGDKEECTGTGQQKFLQPGYGFNIQMVGWFVQEQQVRIADQGPGQQHPSLHAAGQLGKISICFKLQTGKYCFNLLPHLPDTGGFHLMLNICQFGQQGFAVIFSQPAAHIVMVVQQSHELASPD